MGKNSSSHYNRRNNQHCGPSYCPPRSPYRWKKVKFFLLRCITYLYTKFIFYIDSRLRRNAVFFCGYKDLAVIQCRHNHCLPMVGLSSLFLCLFWAVDFLLDSNVYLYSVVGLWLQTSSTIIRCRLILSKM